MTHALGYVPDEKHELGMIRNHQRLLLTECAVRTHADVLLVPQLAVPQVGQQVTTLSQLHDDVQVACNVKQD